VNNFNQNILKVKKQNRFNSYVYLYFYLQNGPNDPHQQHMQGPPVVNSSQPNQQPVTSSASAEDEEAKRRLQQPPPTNMHLSPAGYPPQHQQMPPGMHVSLF
jgi:hypothetical protein